VVNLGIGNFIKKIVKKKDEMTDKYRAYQEKSMDNKMMKMEKEIIHEKKKSKLRKKEAALNKIKAKNKPKKMFIGDTYGASMKSGFGKSGFGSVKPMEDKEKVHKMRY